MKNHKFEYENLNKINKIFWSEYNESLKKIFHSGLFILGENVKFFEERFSEIIQTPYCVGVGSGLDALILSLKALNFDPGSEIIAPSNTFIATILSILHSNLKPILVEPDINTYNIDPIKIEEKITSNTKAIIVVHLYGKCCHMEPILKIQRKYDLKLIEDCAQAHDAKYYGKPSGSFGTFGAFSFYPAKTLGALGDAGAITTKDKALADKIKRLRNYGSDKKYFHDDIGYNSRLDEVHAAFLNIKLKYLKAINAHKRKLAEIYIKYLNNNFIKPVKDKDYYDVYHIFNIRHEKRDLLQKYLSDNGIHTLIHYPLALHQQKSLKHIIKGEFPITEEICNTSLSLPISFNHTEDDIYNIIEIMNKF
jgi:dTDP-4-amino-4,6-dideoxygalactose transaminase